ncbi:MAG: tetratricopeptide repeat protein [Pyrinomonadaceae bacterium]
MRKVFQSVMQSLARCIVIGFCLLAATSAAAAAEETWLKVTSPHYLFVGDTGEGDMREVALKFEQFRHAFLQLFPAFGLSSPVPTTVIVFKDDKPYKQFRPLSQGKPAEFISYYQSGLDVNYIVLSLEHDPANLYLKLFHESVHMLIDSNSRGTPDWLNEGLAQYYSSFEFQGPEHQSKVGKPIARNLHLLRTQSPLPLETLFAFERSSANYNEREKAGIFNAQAWALVHYLVTANKGRRQLQLLRFMELLSAGVPAENSFRRAFHADYRTMEKELKEYILREDYQVKFTTLNEQALSPPEMKIAPVTGAEADYFLGDLLLHINRHEDAATYLRKSINLNPKSGLAYASLAMARVRQKKFEEAGHLLQQAIAIEPNNHLTHYYYAYALSREGMNEEQAVTKYDPALAQLMRAELSKAISLNSGFPESYRLMAFINLVTGERLEEAVGLLARALALAPGRPDFKLLLAQIYLRKKDTTAARNLLTQLINSGANARLRARAQSMLDHLKAETNSP